MNPKGRPKIQDQWTDRTDLSKGQKFRLRHPEVFSSPKHKSKHASNMRVWRDKNPDAWQAILERRKKKVSTEKVDNFRANGLALVKHHNKVGRQKTAEIMRLHERGKSIADIAIWMTIPMSAVMAVVNTPKSPLDSEVKQQ